jgi:hypothetical protein
MSFSDGADDLPMALTVGIEPVQDLHGYDHPWVGGAGKNLLDDVNGIKHGYYDFSTVEFNANDNYIAYNITLPAGTYTFSTDLEDCHIIRYFINGTRTDISTTKQSQSFTLSAESDFKISIRKSDTSSIASLTPHSMIESGSTATSYAPYSNICPISG